jgi:hypothetical protein
MACAANDQPVPTYTLRVVFLTADRRAAIDGWNWGDDRSEPRQTELNSLLATNAQDDDDLSDASPTRKVSPRIEQLLQALDGKELEDHIFGKELNAPNGERRSLDETLMTKVDEMSRAAGLSETQTRKLLLAGRGDIRRFRDRVDEVIARCRATSNATDILQEVQRLRSAYRGGLFAYDSLFAKTSIAILTPEQTARVREIPVIRFRNGMAAGVGMWSIFLELRDEQRVQLVELVLKNARPPRVFAVQTKWAFHNLVLVQLSRIPAKQLQPLFNRDQWDTLQNCIRLAPGALENLQQQGTVLGWDSDLGLTVLR